MADTVMELLAWFAYQREVYFPLCTHRCGAFVHHPWHLNKQQESLHVRAEALGLHREAERGRKDRKQNILPISSVQSSR